MALEAYRKKRNFDTTPEPPGNRGPAPAADSFVVQKHDARRLHYDFRLEMDGVLKSCVVAKGPSLVPGEKRLAGHVEDHPPDYGDFEGTIPKGESVIIWDRGRWSPIGDPRKGYAKGQLNFELQAVNSRAGGSASFPDAHRPSARRDRSCATSSGNLSRRSAVLDESRAHGGRRHVYGINSSRRALLS